MAEQGGQERVTVRDQAGRFWLGWVVANTIGGLGASIVGGAIALAGDALAYRGLAGQVWGLVGAVLAALVLWAVLGQVQRLFLRRYFLHVDRWAIYTTFGGVGGMSVVLALGVVAAIFLAAAIPQQWARLSP